MCTRRRRAVLITATGCCRVIFATAEELEVLKDHAKLAALLTVVCFPLVKSKAALDQCIRAWRVEHPDRRFVRVVMGNCQPTEFGEHMGDELLGEAITRWAEQAIPGGLMHVDDVGRALASSLAVALDHPEIDSSELKLDARTV